MKTTLLMILALGCCLSCGRGGGRQSAGKTEAFAYASNISMVETEEYTMVTIRDPWDTLRTLHTYLLVPKGRELPVHMPHGTVVRTPLSRSVIYTAVHCSLLKQLGAFSCIAGVCDLTYIQIPEIQEGCAEGRISDLGNGMAPDVEKMIDLAPDAILLSPFENSGGYGRVEKIGIPLVECADYMENSPLGRAEWMRFYGKLFGCEARADSLFAVVEEQYNALKALAAGSSSRPTMISDLRYGATWYVPGGSSTLGILYGDAGARYLWADDAHSGSVPLSVEAVLNKGQEADFWIIKYNQERDKTLSEMAADYAPYTTFRAFREGRVYGCNTGNRPYYEETPFRPDFLLQDLIGIFHPELLPGDTLRYFKQLQQ